MLTLIEGNLQAWGQSSVVEPVPAVCVRPVPPAKYHRKNDQNKHQALPYGDWL